MSKTYKKWTQADVEFILQNHDMLDKDIAAKLSTSAGQNITPSMIRRQRRKSGLSKKRGRPCKNKAVSTTIVSN
jgi:hypothetical protein